MTNLLDNALKYSEPRSEVVIAAMLTETEVTIAVSDRGCGIDAEHLPRLFERFYRVDKARSRKLGGTGLGLAIVKHIVQAHHGAHHRRKHPRRRQRISDSPPDAAQVAGRGPRLGLKPAPPAPLKVTR